MKKLITLATAATLSFGGLTAAHADQDLKTASEEITFMHDNQLSEVQGSAVKKQIVKAPGKFKGKGPKYKIRTFNHHGGEGKIYFAVRIQ